MKTFKLEKVFFKLRTDPMSHVIPQGVCKHLTKLQEECTQQPIENIWSVLNSEWDKELLSTLTDFKTEPEGVASIAQVHRAKLNGKQELELFFSNHILQR